MNQDKPGPDRRPLLIGVGGRSADILNSLNLLDSGEILLLDTDSRTEKRYPHIRTITVGKKIVGGEGSGANMNLARACFKMDMEDLAPLILGRPIVLLVASTDGATGIAGSVEIGSLLIKVGLPSFSFLLHESSMKRSGMDPLHMASILLDGPLRPGCIIVNDDPDASFETDPFQLSSTIPYLLSGSGSGPDFPLSSTSWNSLREDGGPFEIGRIDNLKTGSLMEMMSPAIVSVKVPMSWTNKDVRSAIDRSFGHLQGLHMALEAAPGIEDIQGAYISKATKKPPVPQGPPPDPDVLKDILGGPLEMEMGPDLNIP